MALPPCIPAGELRHRVTIQKRNDSARDAYGKPIEDWATRAVRWAKIEGSGGAEVQEDRQTVGAKDYKFTIRYLSGLDETDRISWNSRTFNIVAISNPGQINREHVITAKEKS